MPKTAGTLDEILTHTRARVAALRRRAAELERAAAQAPTPRAFLPPLASGGSVGVVAEVKRRSPSQGAIRPDLDPVSHARAYVRGGAVAVSVLTDDVHFGGSVDDLSRVAAAVEVPVLRKDFILDPVQLLEARAAGASAVLLIVRALAPERLATLARAARDLGLGTLIEAHDEREVAAALGAGPTAVGVNARDLATFRVDFGGVERALRRVPADVPAVAESGVETRADVDRLAQAGADYVLVGTSVARSADPEAAVRALVGVEHRGRGGATR